MSEPIPESIPTSMDPRSRRPTKKRALSPTSQQASALSSLFAHPEKEIPVPTSSTAHSSKRSAAAPPEIVANVQGSSAGAGSGEFHVYKASRRREYERLKAMDEEVREEKENEEFEREREERERRDEEKTRKNRERREKMKARKGKGGKGGKGGDVGLGEGKEASSAGGVGGGVKGPRVDRNAEVTSRRDEADENGQVVEDAPEAGLIIHDDD
jgi:hypothetical protein